MKAEPMESIRVESVVKQFGSIRALDGVSVEIAAGELFFLLGASGCGKSTLLRCVAGLEAPTSGRVYFGDRDVTDLRAYKREAAMVFQSYALWPHLTVARNVSFGLEERGVSKPDIQRRVGEALEMVKLSGFGDRSIDQMSGGQQQRVSLARALVVRPKCLLLDEPLSNLDAQLRVEMRREIRRIVKENGLTAIYVTHDQEEALAMADRMTVMQAGRIDQLGTPGDIYREPRSAYVANFIGETNLIAGELVELAGRLVRIKTSGGLFSGRLTDPGWTPSKGDPVTLSIRPEAWELGEGADNSAVGSITDRIYLGQRIQYWIETDLGPQQVVELNPQTIREPGADAVCIRVRQEDVIVLKS